MERVGGDTSWLSSGQELGFGRSRVRSCAGLATIEDVPGRGQKDRAAGFSLCLGETQVRLYP